MNITMETERESAIAALVIAGLAEREATDAVTALQKALPEAAAEDLVQIALQSAILGKLTKSLLQIPEELKPFLPQLAPALEQMRKTMKLPSNPWLGKKRQ
jgi:hypothetical protein